ncbi:MAG TPA: protein translocase subunit SecF [Candidatus Dependentiae bacterium]|nr:protein translocase subunit SecF [Candidatus Dependentiae bacterium]
MIDFLKARWVCLGFSVVLVSTFIGGFIYKKATKGSAFEYSIDFTGGTQAHFKFEKPIHAIDVKEILAKKGWNAEVGEFGSSTDIRVRVKEFTNDAKGLAEHMREAIEQTVPDNPVKLMQSEAVGESVGDVLRSNSIWAIFLSILAILAYIAFRFWSGSFGAATVISLVHDTIVLLGACMFLNIEISTTVIAAILALLGYSNNDTIVNFSQIRKNLKQMHGASLYTIINTSLNQMLRRTILTSVATALTVLSMYLFGGEVLRDFSLLFLLGIVFGTYSSIYIASPIILWFYKEK